MAWKWSGSLRAHTQAWVVSAVALFPAGVPETQATGPRPALRDFVGLNGHTVQFRPDLYRQVCSLVRDYHPVEWDLSTNTTALPPFPRAKNGVDWQSVYGAWRTRGFRINASLMFESIPRANWTDLEPDARAYGRAFAREFGPSGKLGLVDTAEIGNEPGKWSDADYTRVFRALAEGLREGDPKLRIATCNLTTGASGDYEKSVQCIAALPHLVDVLSVHSYAQLEGWPTWHRSFPEDPALPKYLPDIEALCCWRDAHAPGKPVWVTEFGYDSSTRRPEPTGDFARWEGVTDEQQAQWLVRSILVFSALPVERAYVYFFNDDDQPSLHASAGLTRGYVPKPSYHALAHLQRTLGDYHFHAVLTNAPGVVRAHEYRHASDPAKSAWAVWSPTREGSPRCISLGTVDARLKDVQRLPLIAASTSRTAPASPPEATQSPDGAVVANVTGSPLYLLFEAEPSTAP